MANALRHRGPDDEGYHIDGAVGLGHRRLSIIDVDGGRQPISNERGSIWIVFNGEIYNYPELRRELQEGGHRFSTDTDTETIVHLYEEMGERCVERLRGMFAFAIWDSDRRRLFLARDRLGQKPLFYSHRGNTFIFASEVKGILAESSVPARLDHAALHTYLALRLVPSPATMFEGVMSLPPAHSLTFEGGKVSLRCYWQLRYLPKLDGSLEDLTDQLEELLRDAVRSHLVSDVQVGTFLSGGIDSSLVTAFAAESHGPGLPTFSIGSEDETFDELPAARVTSRFFQTDHHEKTVKPDIVSLLPAMVHHLDMPGDPIAACQYFVAQLAGEHVKVALGGDGGDELFGGYDRLAAFHWVDYYAALPEVVRRRLFGPFLSSLRGGYGYKNTLSKLRWLQDLSFYEGAERYAEATAHFRFNSDRLAPLYGAAMVAQLRETDPRQTMIDAFEAAEGTEILDRMLHTDTTLRLPDHLLVLNDRMTMSQSLEGRSPILDHHVAEFAARLPTSMKVKGRRLKVILRNLARRHLPPEVVNRPKQGFMFPIARWLQEDLRGASSRLLLESEVVNAGLLLENGVRTLLEEHWSGREDHHHRLWMLLNVEVWFRHYMCGEPVDRIADDMRVSVTEGSDPAPAGDLRPRALRT